MLVVAGGSLIAACTRTAEEPAAPPTEAVVGPTTAAEPTVMAVASPTTSSTDLGGRVLRVGTDATYRPFEFTNDAGEIVGIDPDLMARLCTLANCVAEFQNTSWEGIFPALAAGEFDVVMSAVTILAEREELSNASFTDPYFEVGQVVLTTVDSAITAPSEVGDATIGVQNGTTGDTAATDDLGVPAGNIMRFETIVLAIEALKNGDVDAVVLDNPTAEVFVADNPDALRVAGEPFTTEQYGILVPNSTPEVREALNAALASLRASGEIDTLVERWYSQETG
jgi:polar amino acid transport system substrate-binding protein